MGDLVNLNKARKARARMAEAAQAAANRVKHGRTAAERANDRRAAARLEALLDGTRQAPSGPAEPSGAPTGSTVPRPPRG